MFLTVEREYANMDVSGSAVSAILHTDGSVKIAVIGQKRLEQNNVI